MARGRQVGKTIASLRLAQDPPLRPTPRDRRIAGAKNVSVKHAWNDQVFTQREKFPDLRQIPDFFLLESERDTFLERRFFVKNALDWRSANVIVRTFLYRRQLA